MRFDSGFRRYLGLAIACATLLPLLMGCGSNPSHTASPDFYKAAAPDPWLLTCVDPTLENPALIWNGLIGIRVGRDGLGDGPMFLIDAYGPAGEEKILTQPNILAGTWTAGPDNVQLRPTGGANYKQVLDMASGVLTTTWSQKVGDASFTISTTSAVQPGKRRIVQTWDLASDTPVDIQLRPAHRMQLMSARGLDVVWKIANSGRTVAEHDEPGPDARIQDAAAKKTAECAAGCLNNRVDPAHPYRFARTFDIAPIHGSISTLKSGAREILDLIRATWSKRWQTDIEIDGPVEDQQAVHSFLFYLRSAIDPNGGMSISPFGLSSSQYNGHVFWDADIWVFPALALIDPAEAKAIPKYRLATRKGAIDNAVNASIPDKPHITEYEPWLLKSDYPKYAWESSATGRETAPVAMRNEEHINGDVPWMLSQAAALGLVRVGESERATTDASRYWMGRSEAYVRSGDPNDAHFRAIRGVTSPDESHTGDNDLYTNLLAQWCVDGGHWLEQEPPGRNAQPPVFRLPRDNISFLTYDNDPLKGYKQAAAVLSIYPLQYPPAEREGRVMMDRFADKVIKNGPAMTDSLHALIWARLGEADKAYETWEKSWREFVKEPHLQFSEKRNKASTYFTTGAAGCLQTVIYGFLGFRIDSKKQDGAQWSVQLPLEQVLSVKPNLPQSWKGVKFKNFIVLGKRYTLTATHSGVHVTQGDQ